MSLIVIAKDNLCQITHTYSVNMMVQTIKTIMHNESCLDNDF